jgi:hypothetical protein
MCEDEDLRRKFAPAFPAATTLKPAHGHVWPEEALALGAKGAVGCDGGRGEWMRHARIR